MRMRLYLITFEFAARGDYSSLKARLHTLGARQLMEHQWAVRIRFTATEPPGAGVPAVTREPGARRSDDPPE